MGVAQITQPNKACFYGDDEAVSNLLYGLSNRTCYTSHVCQSVLTVIPAAIRQVNSPNESNRLVDDYNLLMVCP